MIKFSIGNTTQTKDRALDTLTRSNTSCNEYSGSTIRHAFKKIQTSLQYHITLYNHPSPGLKRLIAISRSLAFIHRLSLLCRSHIPKTGVRVIRKSGCLRHETAVSPYTRAPAFPLNRLMIACETSAE